MVFNSIAQAGFYVKSRPGSHKLEGITTQKHPGVVVSALPRPYPKTSQQKKVGAIAKECAIHTGMGRGALVKAMIECVGPKMRK